MDTDGVAATTWAAEDRRAVGTRGSGGALGGGEARRLCWAPGRVVRAPVHPGQPLREELGPPAHSGSPEGLHSPRERRQAAQRLAQWPQASAGSPWVDGSAGAQHPGLVSQDPANVGERRRREANQGDSCQLGPCRTRWLGPEVGSCPVQRRAGDTGIRGECGAETERDRDREGGEPRQGSPPGLTPLRAVTERAPGGGSWKG